jgi:hypothetical protein
MHDKIPHLRAVQPDDPLARLPLNQAAAMCVDSAELFVFSLGHRGGRGGIPVLADGRGRPGHRRGPRVPCATVA